MINPELFDEKIGPDALVINFNKSALQELHSSRFSASLELFQKAQDWLKLVSSASYALLKSMTLNNLANLYVIQDDLINAHACLSEAQSLIFSGSKTNLAITYMNIASVESKNGSHEDAVNHITQALAIFKENANKTINIMNATVAATYNLSIEYNFLGAKQESIKKLKEAWQLSSQNLGIDNALSHEILQALNGAGIKATSPLTFHSSHGIGLAWKGEKKLEKILGRRSTNQSIGACEFSSIRFLTGERLQPMFEIKKHRKRLSRPGSKTENIEFLNRSTYKKERTLIKNNRNDIKKLEIIRGEIQDFQEKNENFKGKQALLKVSQEKPEENNLNVSLANQKTAREKERTRQKAALDIQRLIRGWRERQKTKVKKQKQQKATKSIVNAFKGFLCKENIKEKFEKLKMIPEVDSEIEEDHETKEINRNIAAVIIQKCVKGKLERNSYKKTVSGVIKIQANIRMWLVKRIYKSIYEAIVFIQAYYRKYRASKALSTKL